MHYEKSTLSNGITVLTDYMQSVRSISMGVWFRVGSRDESKENCGISHFSEHMMFKGTKTRSAVDISCEFESIGAESNAFTSKEYTCYYARFVDEKIEQAAEILADMVINSVFAADAIDSESKVVIEEIARSEDDPDDQVTELYAKATYGGDVLGEPVLGNKESVASLKHDDFVSYHDKNYVGSNCFIVAAGNVDHKKFTALCERLFAGMPKGDYQKRSLNSLEQVNFSAIKKDTEQAHLIFGYKGIKAADEQRYAVSTLFSILGGGMSSRLFQEVREKRGLVYSIYATTNSYEDIGNSMIYAGTRPSNISELSKVVGDEIRKIAELGVTQEELERACNYISGQLLLSLESTSSRMIKLGHHLVINYPCVDVEETIKRYREVKVEDVNRAAKRLLCVEPIIAIVSPLEPKKAKAAIEKGISA